MSDADWDLERALAEQNQAPKPWWQSRRGIGIAMVVVSQVAGLVGYDINVPALTEAIVSAIALLGLALSWWGWVKAQRPISKRIVPGADVLAERLSGSSGGGSDGSTPPPPQVPPESNGGTGGGTSGGVGPFGY